MVQLSRNVILLGNGHFNHYVAGRQKAALIEAGMSAGISAFAEQWDGLENKPDIACILALHSHFDHVCGIPPLKKLFPAARVMASPRTAKLLSSEKVRPSLQIGDNLVTEAYYSNGRIFEKPPQIDTDLLQVDAVLNEGERIDLGEGLELQIIEVPGHSPCSIAAYLPDDQVMFVSDAAGTSLMEGIIAPVFFQDYDLYVDSIKKLMGYDIEILAPGHGEAVTGRAKVQDYLQRAVQSAEQAFADIRSELRAGTGEEELARRLYDTYITGGLTDYPAPVMIGSMMQLIKNVKARS